MSRLTRRKARRILDECQSQIDRNVAEYFAGAIDYRTFGARQTAAHDALSAAGQTSAFCRRWRRRVSA